MIDGLLRVRIVGSPGSGKTYFARKISNHSNLPYINLDDLFWSKGHPADEKVRDAKLNKVLDSEQWIIEGSFDEDWVSSTFDDATMVIVLNPNPVKRAWRILRSIMFTKPFREFIYDWKLNWKYNRNHLPGLLKKRSLQHKFFVFSSADKAYKFFIEKTKPDLFL